MVTDICFSVGLSHRHVIALGYRLLYVSDLLLGSYNYKTYLVNFVFVGDIYQYENVMSVYCLFEEMNTNRLRLRVRWILSISSNWTIRRVLLWSTHASQVKSKVVTITLLFDRWCIQRGGIRVMFQ